MTKTKTPSIVVFLVVCLSCTLWSSIASAEVSPAQAPGEEKHQPTLEPTDVAPTETEQGQQESAPTPEQAAPEQATPEQESAPAPEQAAPEQAAPEQAAPRDPEPQQVERRRPSAQSLLSNIRSSSGVDWHVVSFGVR